MRLEIRKRENAPKRAMLARDYLFLIDGCDISEGLTEFTLRMDAGCINRCEITISPSEIEVDADAVASLEAIAGGEGGG